MLKIPDVYTVEDSTQENRDIFDQYKNIIRKYHETARGHIFDSCGNTIWEEPEDDYLNRMSDLGYLVIR